MESTKSLTLNLIPHGQQSSQNDATPLFAGCCDIFLRIHSKNQQASMREVAASRD